MQHEYLVCALLISVLGGGCATYRPMPLKANAAAQTTFAQEMGRIRLRAQEIKHPILKPVRFDDRDGISPDEAAVLAVLANPALRAVRDRRGIAGAELLRAGLLPNPQLSYSIGFPTGGKAQESVNAFDVGLNWEVSGLMGRAARLDAAAARAGAVDLDVAWREWQLAEAAKAAVYRLAAIKRQVALAREMDARLAENLGLVEEALRKGELTERDAAAAQAARDEAHGSFLALKENARQQKLTLKRLLGFPAGSPVKLEQGIDFPSQLRVLPRDDLLRALQSRRLDLLALKQSYEGQDAAVRAAVLAQFPRVSIGVVHDRDTDSVVTTGFEAGVDLPVFDRNQAAIAGETATRQRLLDEYASRVFEAHNDVAKILAGIESIPERISTAETALSNLQRLVDAYREAVQRGQADVLSYYTAWNNLTKKRIDVLTLKLRLVESRIALELATGMYDVTGRQAGKTREPAGEQPRGNK